jgi:cytochrome c oxidase cbb3-type subunit III
MLSSPGSLYARTAATAILCLASALLARSQTSSQNVQEKNARPKNVQPDSMRGRQAFASTCAGCHGLDGKGGERAPNIADRPTVQRLSDAQIFRIVQNGIPGTGMPAFHSLERSQINALVAYLRVLQGAKKTVAALPGDPTRGKTVFFGKAKCSSCHMVAGEGGFIASDLSEYAATHQVSEIRDAIVKPASGNNGNVHLMTLTTHGGEKFVGRVRNEDNFSLQLQTLDGMFHFLSKSDIATRQSDSQTLMPTDYASTLSAAELDDVINYLTSVAGGKAKTAAKRGDWEE